MIESLLYLLAMALALSYPTGYEPLHFIETGRRFTSILGWEIPTAFLIAGVVVIGYGLWSAGLFSLGLDESDPGSIRRLGRRRRLNRGLSLVLYGLLVYVVHFPLEVRVEWSVTISVALALTPFLLLVLANAVFSSLREVILKRDENLAALILFHLKAFAGFALVPLAAMLVLFDLIARIPALERFVAVHPVSVYFFTLGSMLGFILLVPYVIRFVFGAYPLPEDGFRQDLDALARRAGFRYADLMVLPTFGTRLGNAFIVGLFGPMRYVFFTEYLLQTLNREEIGCVMAHEIGHAKRHHLPAFFFLSVTSIVFSAVFYAYLAQERSPFAPVVFPVTMFAWVFLLGFISRRFETEADLFGAKLVGDYDAFSRALLSVAVVNGVPPDVGGFRHFSIANRVQTVQSVKRQPLVGEVIELISKTIRRFAFWFFFSALSILLTEGYRQIRQAPHRERAFEAYRLVERGRASLLENFDVDRAERDLLRAVDLAPEDGRAHLYLSYALLGAARFDDSARHLARAREIGMVDPLERLLADNVERTHSPYRRKP